MTSDLDGTYHEICRYWEWFRQERVWRIGRAGLDNNREFDIPMFQ